MTWCSVVRRGAFLRAEYTTIMADAYVMRESSRADKKWMVELPNNHVVHFGAAGYEDFTQHRDEERRARYVRRHRERENWGKSGAGTAGFWSRWILWGPFTSISRNIAYVRERFGMRVILRK